MLFAFTALLYTLAAQSPATYAALRNLTYELGPDDERVVEMKNGRWTDPEPGGSTFRLLKEHAIGDLNGDNRPDAAALVVEETTGEGRFYSLFVFLNRGGQLEQLEAPEWLGDRSRIQGVSINGGVLTVRFITHADADPACCPTLKAVNRYRIVNGALLPE